MWIVKLRLRFTTPCLGNCLQDATFMHLRDGEGQVVFLQSWWESAIVNAAQAVGQHVEDVKRIRWSPVVDGHIKMHKRWYKRDKYRKHEAFEVGDEIAVKAMVPSEISMDVFKEIIGVLGEFFGISPFRHSSPASDEQRDAGFGRFKVLEVKANADRNAEASQHLVDEQRRQAATVCVQGTVLHEDTVRGGSKLQEAEAQDAANQHVQGGRGE